MKDNIKYEQPKLIPLNGDVEVDPWLLELVMVTAILLLLVVGRQVSVIEK
jgi:hypothetical protein